MSRTRRDPPHHRRDRHPLCARRSTARARARARPASASSTTCSTRVARHGGLDLDVDGAGRPGDRRRTTPSRTPGSCSGRRSTRRSATAPGSRATATPWCRWTRRAPVRDRHLRPAVHRVRGRRCPAGAIGGLRHRPRRGVLARGGQHGEADAARAGRGGHATPTTWWRRCSRRSRARCAQAVAIDPARAACRRRRASVTAVAILDYGMGNLRSVEKALEHVGARAELTRDHERVRARRRRGAARRRARSRKAMEAVRELGPRRAAARARGAGVPVLGICLGMQLLFERSTELGGAEGIGLLEGEVRGARRAGLKIPQIGWNPVSLARRVAAERRACPTRAPSTTCTRSRRARRATRTSWAPPSTAASSSARCARPTGVYGVQFHPEKSGPDGLRAAAQLRRACAVAA